MKKLLKKMPQLRSPIFIQGLPGIGNVGKVAVDFMIDELKATKMMEIRSDAFPHSVFVNEGNIVELPTIELYYKQLKNKKFDLLFLAGDIQPIDERSSYEFTEKLLDLLRNFDTKEVITIGGIGLPAIPEQPKIYCTGNGKEIIKKYREGTEIQDSLYGVVGPIVGMTGLLIGMAGEQNIPGVCFLAETYGHPLYLGIKGSQEVLRILNNKLSLNLDLNALNKEIQEIEQEIIKKTKQLGDLAKKARPGEEGAATYIG